MAFSPGHYRQGSGGLGHGSSVVDGVQVKISEQFLPPKKVMLPVDYKTGNPSEVLFMEYDFSLETKVLEWTENQRKAQEALEKAKQEELERIVNSETDPDDNPETINEESDKDQTVVPNGSLPQDDTQRGPVVAPAKSASPSGLFMNVSLDILTPTVIASTSSDNNSNQRTILPPPAKSTSFNLADFENEQDPFDSAELKTLDDMAELNKVLQGAQSAGSTDVRQVSSHTENHPADEKLQVNLSAESTEPSGTRTDVSTPVHDMQNANQVNQQPTALNIKDVEYPDFDTLETPDVSLTETTYSIASQQRNDTTSASYSTTVNSVASQEQVYIHPGSYNSVSFSNKQVPTAVGPGDGEKGSPAYSTNSSHYSSAQSSSTQYALSSPQGYSNYNVDSGKIDGSSSHQQQHNVINGLTSNISNKGMSKHSSPMAWATAGVSNNPWSTPASVKTTPTPWQTSKNYASTNPWGTPRNSTQTGNPWNNQIVSTHSSNPWGTLNPSISNPWGAPNKSAYSTNPWGEFSGGASTLRSAKSNPDLTKLTEKPARVIPTSHTPPPTTRLAGNKTPPPRPSSNQSWNPYKVLPPTSSSVNDTQQQATSNTSTRKDGLPDPYNGMAFEDKRFVDRIADMGFSRARVARAAQKLGQDDKAVVDHLCRVNKLAEQGLNADEAENALYLFEQNEEKVKDYIKLSEQFKELGFPEEKIQEALIDSDLDENKTLDALTTS